MRTSDYIPCNYHMLLKFGKAIAIHGIQVFTTSIRYLRYLPLPSRLPVQLFSLYTNFVNVYLKYDKRTNYYIVYRR